MKKEININFDYSTVPGSTEMHNKFKKEFMICACKKFEDISIIPYDVGFVRAYSEPEICYQVGQPGVPDTIVFGEGWYLLLDMKTGKARLSKLQKALKNRIAEINKGVERVFKITSVRQGLNLIEGQYD